MQLPTAHKLLNRLPIAWLGVLYFLFVFEVAVAQPGPPPGALATNEPPRISYLYTQQLQPVGISQISYEIRRAENCIYKKQAKSSLLGSKEEEEISAVLGLDFTLKSGYIAMHRQGQAADFCIITVSDRIILQRPQKMQTFPLTPFYLDISDFLQATAIAVKNKPTLGRVYRANVLATDRNSLTPCRARYMGEQTIPACLQEMSCQVWEVNTPEFQNFWAKAYLNAKAQLIGYEMGEFRMTLVPLPYALEYLKPKPTRPQPIIFNLDQWQQMELTVEWAATGDYSARANAPAPAEPTTPLASIIPNRPFQKLVDQRITLQSPPAPDTRLTWDKIALRSPEFLAPTSWLPANHPLILQLSQSIRTGVTQPTEIANRIAQWTYQNLETKITPQGQRLAMFLGLPRFTPAAAHVVLCRACGLPARFVSGLEYQSGRFYYSTWAEVYLGTWLPISQDRIGNTGPKFLTIYENNSWADQEIPLLTLILQTLQRPGITLSFADSSANYLQKKSITVTQDGQKQPTQQITDYLLGIAFTIPPGWIMLDKDPKMNNLTLRSLQGEGPAIVIQVLEMHTPLEEFLQTIGEKMSEGQTKLELLWQQPKPFISGKAYEFALKNKDNNVIYRALAAQVKSKVIVAFLVVPEQTLPQIEPGFQIWKQSLCNIW